MCPTLLSLLSLGFCVSLRIWAAVGEHDKPSLSAWPSPMVPLGQTVTLQCHFDSPLKIFRLFKTDGASLPELHGNHFNNFTLGPVTREHAGSYTCSGFSRSLFEFSRHSDPLQIVVTGVFTKPSISAHPSPLMRAGENVTVRCHSLLWFDKFILHQENSTGNFQRHGQMLTGGHAPADFSIGPKTLASAGTYRCYGSFSHSPFVWSAPSNPVNIIISGRSRKPSLSAQGGPVVRSEENVTLVCSSESAFDQFHLLKEVEDLGHLLSVGWGPRGALQAEFPLGPGTPALSGVYRCYGSFTRSPYSWSDPSDPLFLSVTGSTTSTYLSPTVSHTTEETPLPQEHCSTWYIILGLLIAFTSTSIILTALVCHWCSTPNHVANMQGEPMEDRTVNGEDSEAEDVIYANLDLGTLSERRSTPAPLRPMPPSAETIIYEEFNINQDHAEPRPDPIL
ncbi:putative killer cell immunoglobulin-like receptor-like protein KIR3DX1 [Budorcas taxicolor]|uniref:putative killer cell immunoglobulin-like receptor-like protein KIR3DX1 n=1 Tax=Budorcas taxicolor TaxID=37181 RepID=UPI002283724D|nr:putative killer cell immunoglobulin-like receptor-like protein KIR3DX1 [Budorcas taxicolor]